MQVTYEFEPVQYLTLSVREIHALCIGIVPMRAPHAIYRSVRCNSISSRSIVSKSYWIHWLCYSAFLSAIAVRDRMMCDRSNMGTLTGKSTAARSK